MIEGSFLAPDSDRALFIESILAALRCARKNPKNADTFANIERTLWRAKSGHEDQIEDALFLKLVLNPIKEFSPLLMERQFLLELVSISLAKEEQLPKPCADSPK